MKRVTIALLVLAAIVALALMASPRRSKGPSGTDGASVALPDEPTVREANARGASSPEDQTGLHVKDRTVYYVNNKTYHTFSNCSTIRNHKGVKHMAESEAKKSDRKLCKVCKRKEENQKK